MLVGTSQFHNIDTPRDAADATRKEPDPFHIDWVTVCDASITELEHAWYVNYWTSNKPMRTLLCGGLEDLAAGKSVTDVIEQILHFKQKVDRQSPRNEFVVAALLNPPKYNLFEDNGEPSRNHKNLIREIKELNSWIVKFDSQIGMQSTPRLHRLGVKDGWTLKDGKRTRIKRHIFFSVVKQGATKQKI